MSQMNKYSKFTIDLSLIIKFPRVDTVNFKLESLITKRLQLFAEIVISAGITGIQAIRMQSQHAIPGFLIPAQIYLELTRRASGRMIA
jgi:hypothetical protein